MLAVFACVLCSHGVLSCAQLWKSGRVRRALPMAGSWNGMSFKVLSNPHHSRISWSQWPWADNSLTSIKKSQFWDFPGIPFLFWWDYNPYPFQPAVVTNSDPNPAFRKLRRLPANGAWRRPRFYSFPSVLLPVWRFGNMLAGMRRAKGSSAALHLCKSICWVGCVLLLLSSNAIL